MQAHQVVHILSVVVALITTVSASVYGVVGALPEAWQAPVITGVGILGVVATAITAAISALKQQQIDAANGNS